MKIFILPLLLILASCGNFTEFETRKSKYAPELLESDGALKKAFTLPLTGTLKRKRDGYIYLKVNDDYIYSLKSYFEGARTPPYFRESDSPGAHISVVYADESYRLPKNLPELQKKFSFTPIRFEKVTNREGKVFYYLVVESKELEDFRTKYGLSRKLHGHEYHITVGYNRVIKQRKPYFRHPKRVLEPAF